MCIMNLALFHPSIGYSFLLRTRNLFSVRILLNKDTEIHEFILYVQAAYQQHPKYWSYKIVHGKAPPGFKPYYKIITSRAYGLN